MGRPVRRRVAALVALAALLTAGCTGLPTSGPVVSGPEIDTGNRDTTELRQYFPGPQDGASVDGIVQGFVRAGAATDGTYTTARRFLTGGAAERWNPDATIVIQSDDEAPTVTKVDDTTLRLSVDVAGTVGSDGRYEAAVPGDTATATVRLTRVGGQWRIAELPEGFGRFVKASDAPRLVRPFAVHYISSSRRATVADVRWFPLDRLAPRLARAQLDPVPDFLRGAAVSAVPDGARLLGDAVSVDEDGVAAVNLISGPLEAGEATRQNLWAQFVRTLTQDPEVVSVSLSVDGVPVDLSGVDGPVSTLDQIGFPSGPAETTSTKPIVRRGADVTVFDPSVQAQDRASGRPASTYPQIPQAWTHLALSADGREVAAVDPGGDGISRWRDDTRYEVPGVGARVSSPSYDRRGFLWVGAVADGADRLFVVDTRADPADPVAARPTPVVADWLVGRRVVEAKVAADGDRVAVLSTRADGRDPRVDLAGVVRTDAERPQRLAAPLRLGIAFSSARGLAWTGDQTLATVASIRGRSPRPTVLTVGGDLLVLSAVRGASAVANAGTEGALYVLTSDGTLFLRSGPRWVESGPADDLAAAAG